MGNGFAITSNMILAAVGGGLLTVVFLCGLIFELRHMKKRFSSQEALLVKNARLTSMGEMTGSIAHEINSPLLIIKMRAEQTREKLEKGIVLSNQEIIESLKKVESAVDRVSKIVTSVRNLARDTEVEELTRIDVSGLIDDVLELYKKKWKENGVEVRVKVGPQREVAVRVIQVGQVLTNLLNNAFDAVTGNDASWIQIEFTRQEGLLKFVVTNSGPRISEEVLKRLFQPYFTTKSLGKGTGLGLSISSRIATAQGGRLYFEKSSMDTCFILELPDKMIEAETELSRVA